MKPDTHDTNKKQTDKNSLFLVKMRPAIRHDLPLPHAPSTKKEAYVTIFAKTCKTELGAKSIESRPCLSIVAERAWPFSRSKVLLDNGSKVASASVWLFSPFKYRKLEAMYKAFEKAGIEITTKDGNKLPTSYVFEKTVRNISKAVVLQYKKQNEFIVCQRLGI